MYIYVEEVNLNVAPGPVQCGPGQAQAFLDPFQQWTIILLGCFAQARPYFIRINDLKWFPRIHNK